MAATVKLPHKAKKSQKTRKYGRMKKRCERYRLEKGKPRGPGRPGNKSGAGWRPRDN